jgi:hypothetical protein
MIRFSPLALLVLCACAPAVLDTDLPFFGDGYRTPGDACRRVGESNFTNQFLSDSADLVGCPVAMADLPAFVAQTGAILVAEVGPTNLYTVARR